MLRRPTRSRHRNMRQRRIRLRAMPVTFPCFDVHHIADADLALLTFVGDNPAAGSDDEYLIAVMHVPTGRCSSAEIHHVGTKVVRLVIGDQLLPRPLDLSTLPSIYRCRRAHRLFGYVLDLQYAHSTPPSPQDNKVSLSPRGRGLG
jgi:hypothetical protein